MTNLTLTQDKALVNAITHTGVFHADDVMTTVILLKKMGEVNLMRTVEVPEGISEDIIVYDIGGGKFDHHQRGGNGARENGVPYSSVGLIWKEFGYEIVQDLPHPDLVWKIMDRDLIQAVDAADNGELPRLPYVAQPMTLSSIVSGFNPIGGTPEEYDQAFLKAVEWVQVVFENALKTAVEKAKAVVAMEPYIKDSKNGILIMGRYMPWQEALLTSEDSKAEEVLFVIFPSNRGGYNVQAVPPELESKQQRKPLPESWRGLPAEKLQEVSGVDTAIFCHPGGFMCSAKTQADAIKMAKLAIEA